jgi:hypothetical protein
MSVFQLTCSWYRSCGASSLSTIPISRFRKNGKGVRIRIICASRWIAASTSFSSRRWTSQLFSSHQVEACAADLLSLLPCPEDLVACGRKVQVMLDDHHRRMRDRQRKLRVQRQNLLVEGYQS